MISKSILALSALAGAAYAATGETVTTSLAVTTINDNDGIGAGSNTYKFYSGTGTVADGWPALDDWVSFGDMFEANKAHMSEACTEGQTQDTAAEEADIRTAIEAVAKETHVDHRFILAIIMQESGGCVRVQSTSYSVTNPGLMQSHEGSHTCDPNGVETYPCPQSEITGMISDGTAGTSSGDGLAACINQSGATDVSAYYKAARIYNSGSIAASGDLGQGVATHCYASDVANRLTGWTTATKTCTLDD